MYKNHFKIALRFFLKNKLFTGINILGLSIGITAFVLITQYVSFESGYDRHQNRVEDLYRVTLTSNLGEKGFITLATNHPAVGYAMKRDFPEVESYTRLMDKSHMWGSFVLSYTNEHGDLVKSNVVDDKLFIADSTTLDLFDVPLLSGNAKTALNDPLSMVLSERVARRFFGNQDPLGKRLRINDSEDAFEVTGVFTELPENTHLKFDMLASFSTLGQWTNETWIWPDFYNYVRLKPGTDPATVESKFPAFVNTYLSDIMQEHGFEARFALQPVSDIHLKSQHRNEVEANADESTLNFLWIIALFIIAIAQINFINLSTAKSAERAMEVGLKKVVGIKRNTLIQQFLFESLLINLLGTLMAVGLTALLTGPFNALVGLKVLSLGIWFQPKIWAQLIVLMLFGGLLAGAYPAFVLSGFKPVEVLKGRFQESGKGALMRRGLVIAQFAISIVLIAGTYIVHSQFSFMQDQDLGYDVEHNLVINAPRVIDSTIVGKMEVFKNELRRNPKINFVTLTDEVPGKKIGDDNMARQSHERKEAGVSCDFLRIDPDFLDTYGIQLLAGRNFRKEDRTGYGSNPEMDKGKTHRVLINKAASKVLGFQNPEEALHKKITFPMFGPNDRVTEVIGVVENYHQQSLQADYNPTIFLNPNFYDATYLTINMNTSGIQGTLKDIGETFEKFFPRDPFNYFFLEEHFNQQYKADVKFGQICLLFSGLAIFIAVLGLFGLGSYLALKKTKELCVRKVLGANTVQVLVLIPKSLLSLVLISGVIALPITYFLASEWLSNYAFKVAMDPFMFLAPLMLVLVVAALSILPESLKVALLNPAKYLRDE
ncbi:MAG: ABC transporter permease [Bacteroidota bacterium]